MKKILFVLIAISASFAQAATDCSQNPYALTKNSLVIAFDWAEGGFHENTGHFIAGEFYFNSLVDASCEHIEVVSNAEVRCISAKGQGISVGIVQQKQGRYADWDFYNVNWSSSVVIKSQYTNSGCIYGIAVKNH